MAPSHVPNEPMNMYTNPAYEHDLFSRGDRFVAHGGAVPWDQFNQNHASQPQPQSQPQPPARAWHHGGALPQQAFSTMSQSYTNPTPQYQTASPYQYAQYHNGHGHGHGHGPVSGPVPGPVPVPVNTNANFSQPQSSIEPSHGLVVDPHVIRQQQQSPYQLLRSATPQGQTKPLPQSLPHQQNGVPLTANRPSPSPYQTPKPASEIYIQRPAPTPVPIPVPIQPVNIPSYDIPKGRFAGGFGVINQASLAAATNSSALNKFVNFGTEPMHLPTNRTALPVYNPRQSLKELKKSGAGNRRLLESLAKKPSSVRNNLKPRHSASSPSGLKREVSDSESYSDSSDDSEYTDDEEEEPSPLPDTRPDEPHAAVRYDVIKATWHPRMSQPDATKIRQSVNDFWEAISTIQKRWRADTKAVTEAEEQKKTGELPVLKSRVASQRDLLESALKSAIEFAHPNVFHYLGSVKQFLYLCYQFLANRVKAQDYDGGLSSVLYQVLARSIGTMTNELIEETKIMRAMNLMKKHANEANKVLIQQVLDGAAAGSKRQAEQKANTPTPPEVEVTDLQSNKRPAGPVLPRPSSDNSAIKKVKATVPPTLPVKKSPAVTTMSKPGVTNPAVQKRVGDKPGVVPVRAKATQMVNKPTNVFSSLNAASKKAPVPAVPSAASKTNPQQKAAVTAAKEKKPVPPVSRGTNSFAQTMAALVPREEPAAPTKSEKKLPPETPEQKAKRLRKEARRHLRVTFRPDASLVEVKYFSHDPEEEQGHDANFVRDAGDIGGEGRMFKQHIDMTEDEDDDEPLLDYRSWAEPSTVDFSTVPAEERDRNYAPYGGGAQKPISPEKEVNQHRENATLLVFYSDPSDIPPSPREPAESHEASKPALDFGTLPTEVSDRLPVLPSSSDLQRLLSQIQPALSTPTPAVAAPAPAPAPIVPAPLTAPTSDHLQALLQGLPANPSILANFPPPPLPTAVAPPPFDPSAFGAILAQLAASTGVVPGAIPQELPTIPSLPGLPNFQDSAALQQLLAGVVQQDQSMQQHNQHLATAKRPREDVNHNDRGYGSFKKPKGGNFGKYPGNFERPHKVIACKFWKMGNCTKGDDCTFIHDYN